MITGTILFTVQLEVDCINEQTLNREIDEMKQRLIQVNGASYVEVEDQDIEDDGEDSSENEE